MQCPFLTDMLVHYCTAFPIRKLIPSTELDTDSPCVTGDHGECAVFRETQDKVIPLYVGSERTDCTWQKQSIISFRLCTLDYQCHRCQFEQSLQDRNGVYVEPPEILHAIERMRKMPGNQRRCKYMLMSPMKAKPCLNEYRCSECPTYLSIRDAVHRGER